MGGSRSAAPMAMSPSLTNRWIASNARSGPFLLLSSWCGAAVMVLRLQGVLGTQNLGFAIWPGWGFGVGS